MDSEGETAGADARVVLVTAPDAGVAARVGRDLVAARLAACVTVLPGATSIYRWEGEVREDVEALLVIKTRADRIEALEARLIEVHPYDVPECVTIATAHVEARYLAWLQGAAADAR